MKEQKLLRPNERLDDLQNGYRIIQNPESFCFGLDAVLLSDFAVIRKGESVLDLGTGTGIIPFLMAGRHPAAVFTGLELQPDCVEMAVRSIKLNGLEDRIRIIQGDIKEAADLFGAASFRVISCNPPYMIVSHGKRNEKESVFLARHEAACTLEDVVREASGILVSSGRLYLVHRPFRLSEIFNCLSGYDLEPKRIRLVYPYVDREPKLVLIEAVKGAHPGLRIEPPLIVFDRSGVYTEEINRIYHPERRKDS